MSDVVEERQIRLTEKQAQCILFIEQEYMLSGLVPSAEKIADVFGVTPATAKKWLDSDDFDYLLKKKEIRRSGVDGVLTMPQLALVNMLLNLNDRRSEREKCESAGVTPQQLAKWKKDPTFNGYLQERAKKLFGDSDDIAYLAVLKNVQRGDLNAAKFYFEMTGKYQPSVKHTVNIDGFVAGLIEVLQRRLVGQPDLLEVIANDLEEVMAGRRPEFNNMPVIEASSEELLPLPPMPEPRVVDSQFDISQLKLGDA